MGATLYPANTNASFETTILSAIIAGEDIKAGDLLTQTAGGRAFWVADPADIYAQLRPVYQVADAYLQAFGAPVVAAINGASGSFETEAAGVVLFDDGGFAVCWKTYSNGQAPFRDVYLSIYNKDLSVRVAKTLIVAGGYTSNGIAGVQLLKLNSGNVMAVFQGAGDVLSYAIYSQAGAVIKAATVVDSTAQGHAFSAAVLAGGNVAIGYTTSAGSSVKYAVFSATGDVVQAATVIGAYGTLNGLAVSVAGMSDGGFAVAWNAGKVQKFTAAGAASGSSVNVYGNGAATSAYMHIWCVALAGGGIAVASDVYPVCSVYNSALVLQGTYNITGMISTTNAVNAYLTLAPAADGGVFVAWIVATQSSQAIGYAKLTMAGVNTAAGTTANVFVGGGNGQQLRAKAAPDGGCLVTTVSQVVQFDPLMTPIAIRTSPIVQPYSGGSLQLAWGTDATNPNLTNMLILGAGGVGSGYPVSIQSCTWLAPARWPIGVAQADTPKGALVSFVAFGSARTRLVFTKPLNVDATAMPAQRLSLIGNTAIMKGIQP